MPSDPMTAAERMRLARLAVTDQSDGAIVTHDEFVILVGRTLAAIYRRLPWHVRLWYRIRGWFQ